MFRGLIWLAVIAGLVFVGMTVKFGQRTLFGHIAAVWRTEEAQDMREGIEEKAKPVVEKVKRGIEAGMKAANEPNGSGAAADAAPR